MQESFKILFYENHDPIDHRCIERFIIAFSESYQTVVQKIVGNSKELKESTFKENVAVLMPAFKMTRVGAFHGVKRNKDGSARDPNHVIAQCWKRIEDELQELKGYINENIHESRSRVLVDLSQKSKRHVIEKTSELFEQLCKVAVKPGRVTRVGASKVLFAVLPEVALPVDNAEWKDVFKTNKYQKVLSTMVNEIREWERRSGRCLDTLDPRGTLPSIYNVMAMAARSLHKHTVRV